jgi:hypothetical protein
VKGTGAFILGILAGIVGWMVLGQSERGREVRQRTEDTVESFLDGILEGLGQTKR